MCDEQQDATAFAPERKDVYEVPECNLPALEDRIDTLNRKAEKLGCEPVTLEQVGYFEKEGEHGPIRIYKIKVHGPEPIIAGWALIAKLEPAGGGNVIKRIGHQGDDLSPDWRTARIWCDHCNLERGRLSSWIVRHVETGIEKQVGTSCLADFTGHGDPARFVAMAEWLCAVDQAADEAQEYDPDRVDGHKSRLYLAPFLEWVSACVRAYGWMSRGKARQIATAATVDVALGLMTKPREYRKHDDPRPDEQDEQIVKAALAWARDELAGRADLSEYHNNLALVCAEDSIPYEWVGIAGSLIAAYNRDQNQRQERERTAASEYQGTVKKRQEWGPLEVTRIWNTETYYGALWIYTFQDGAGNVYVWKTGQGYDWERGERVTGKATVKEHSEYKGVKQTILTRCSFEVIEAEAT